MVLGVERVGSVWVRLNGKDHFNGVMLESFRSAAEQSLLETGKNAFLIPQNKTPKPNRCYLALIRTPIAKDV